MRIWGSLSVLSAVVAAGAGLSACGAADAASVASVASAASAASASAPAIAAPTPTATASPAPVTLLPAPGNPAGHAYVPPAARAISTAHPAHVIGHGTPASCTSAAVVRAVAEGGVITFSCGPSPVTIQMHATARVHNTSARVVLDGGSKVILSGMGRRRILYMNTCDQSLTWTTDHCQDQSTPRLTVQNLTFTDGRAPGRSAGNIGTGSGGAIYAQGGQFKVVNSRFTNNTCYAHGPDLGGAAIRAFEEWTRRPVYIVHSTFTGGVCSNGGALSSIGVSWTVLNSVLSHNRAIGRGQNPTQPGTLGGGSGGAIYNDGDAYSLTVSGSLIRFNHAREGGGAIFYVCDAQCGRAHLRITGSTLHDNPNEGFFTAGFPGIFYHGDGSPIVTSSTIS